MRFLTRRRSGPILLSLAAATAAVVAAPASASALTQVSSVTGHVYVNDNTAGTNTIGAFDRHADGSLTPEAGSPFAAGGAGSGAGLASQGALEISPEEVPGLIDELPAIGALAAYGGEVTVRGAGELRVKESDRIATLVAGFRALGIDAEERSDGFAVRGPSGGRSRPAGGIADACGDHRMAMAFAIAALGAERPSTIEGADAVAISYPAFFATLERLRVEDTE